MEITTTSPNRAASAAVIAQARPPRSSITAWRVSGPRELLIATWCPARTKCRASVPPMCPAPMMPSRIPPPQSGAEAARFRTDGEERVVVTQDSSRDRDHTRGEPCRRPGNRRRGRVVAAVDVGSWPRTRRPRAQQLMAQRVQIETHQGPSPLLIDLGLLAVAVMWASTFTLFKIAWRDIDPVAFTAVRFAVMFAFSVAILIISRSRVRPSRADLPALAASGLTGFFLYQMGFVLGLDRTSALASAILISTHPIFSVIVVWLMRNERPNRSQIFGVLLGFVGVAVFLRAWDAFAAARPGDLLSLGAAAAFGAYGVINQPLAARYPARELMSYTLGFGGLLVTLFSLPAMAGQDWGQVGTQSWVILAYAIVGPVYLAYALWGWAIRHRGIPRTVVYGFLVPVLGGAIAVLGLDEHVGVEQVIGGLLVVGGLLVTRLHRGPAVSAGSH